MNKGAVSLLEALTQGFDAQNKRDFSTDFARKLPQYRDELVGDFLRDESISLNSRIAEIAIKNAFTDDQIKRLIEETNNQTYLILYNRMKGSKEKEPKFSLADFNQIKAILDTPVQDAKSSKEDKTASDENINFIEKIASFEDEVDSFEYLPSSFSEGSSSMDGVVLQKKIILHLKKEADEKNEKIQKLAAEALTNMEIVASSLLKYDMNGCSLKDAFHSLVKKASIGPRYQKLFKQATENIVLDYKKRGKLPSDYELDMEFIDPLSKSAYSLGEYSLIDKGDGIAPPVFVDGMNIDSIDSLSKIASVVVENQQEVKRIQDDLKNTEIKLKKAGLDFDKLEKIAGCVSMVGKNIPKMEDGFLDQFLGKS